MHPDSRLKPATPVRAAEPPGSAEGPDLNETACSAIDDLRGHLHAECPRYHAFVHRGFRLVYSVSRGTVLELDAADYLVMKGLERGLSAGEIEGDLLAGGYRQPIAERVKRLEEAVSALEEMEESRAT